MRELIKKRSHFFECIRKFFTERGVLEVDTPLITACGVTDPALTSVPCAKNSYLITSPEYAMKTLISRGSGDIYQLSHVFRDEEQGRKHSREFTLLEWYRIGWDHQRLMLEVVELIKSIWPESTKFPLIKSSYRLLFSKQFGVDVLALDEDSLAKFCAEKVKNADKLGLDRDGYLDLLFTHFIEPTLGVNGFEFVVDYPISQAALAKIITSEQTEDRVAARFELYIQGIELCNGFWELTNATLQRERFIEDNIERERIGLPTMPIDETFLQALDNGMPECAGVALGVDRLFMLVSGEQQIQSVILA